MELNERQRTIIVWAVESGKRSFAFETILGDSPHGRLAPAGSGEDQLVCEPSDVRDLEELGLLRTAGAGYELTGLADAMYEVLMNPPAERRPPGFAPPA